MASDEFLMVLGGWDNVGEVVDMSEDAKLR